MDPTQFLGKLSFRIFNGPRTNLEDFKHILVGTETSLLKSKKIVGYKTIKCRYMTRNVNRKAYREVFLKKSKLNRAANLQENTCIKR